MAFLLSLFLAVSGAAAMAKDSQSPPPLVPLNVGECRPGEEIQRSFPSGSAWASIRREEGVHCVVEYFHELEGGFSRVECLVPKSLNRIDLPNPEEGGGTSHPWTNNCKPLERGNLMLQGTDCRTKSPENCPLETCNLVTACSGKKYCDMRDWTRRSSASCAGQGKVTRSGA